MSLNGLFGVNYRLLSMILCDTARRRKNFYLSTLLANKRNARIKTRTKVIGGVIGAVLLFCLLLIFLTFNDTKVGEKKVYHAPREMMPRSAAQLPADPFGAIERALEKLELGNIAFNAPKTINLRDTAIIQLVLGLETPIDSLKQMIEAAGEKEGSRIRVSDRMEARLSGPNFAITAITPEIQAVSRSEITEWKWEVKPSSHGTHSLHLTLSALLNVDGESTPLSIRTFNKMIEVEVTWHQRVGSFFEKNWQWLWAAILVPIVGWLWKRKRRIGTMTSSEKSTKNKDINLETDLLLPQKDITFIREKDFQNDRNLEAYLDLLEDIDAFKPRKVKTKFYAAEFDL